MSGILITKRPETFPMLSHRGVLLTYAKRKDFFLAQFLTRGSYLTPKDAKAHKFIALENRGLILYDGQILNYPEAFDTDHEWLKYLFTEGSVRGALEELNKADGSWSIAYISPENMVYCFTDPLGKKQLYYNDEGEIASEIIPLVGNRPFNPLYKSSVYKWGYNTNNLTPWQGVKRILPNKLYTFDLGRLIHINPEPYFDWTRKPSIEDLKILLEQYVGRKIRANRNRTGVLLSGGLDSSIVAGLVTPVDQNATLYTLRNKEWVYARMTATYVGGRLTTINPPSVFEDDQRLDQILRYNENPIDLGSMVIQHQIGWEIKSINRQLIFTGDGADEVFGGYSRMHKYDSQYSDIFEELSFYHLPKLDRFANRYNLELATPFLSHDVIKLGLNLRYEQRIDKNYLRNLFSKELPDQVVNREKRALKSEQLITKPDSYKQTLFHHFYNLEL